MTPTNRMSVEEINRLITTVEKARENESPYAAGYIEALIRVIRQLLEERSEDSKLIDLERMIAKRLQPEIAGNEIHLWAEQWGDGVRFCIGMAGNSHTFSGNSLREAIDAARKGEEL